eukprot:tig00000093_g3479.t1
MEAEGAKYDLLPRIGPFLDRHLILPMLEFLQETQIYSPDEVLKVKLELISKTNMVDFAMDIHKKLHNVEDVPQSMKDYRTQVVAELKRLSASTGALIELLQDQELIKDLRSQNMFKWSYISERYEDIPPDALEKLYSFAKWQFECGNYSAAAEYLMYYRALSTNLEKNFSALWGKLAAEILMHNWDQALEDLKRLRESIDNREKTAPPATQLQHRTWLLHWSLFVFFNHPNGRNEIIDMFFDKYYMNAIQIRAPWVLRYLSTAVITHKKRKPEALRNLVKVLQQEQEAYSDPITEFVVALYGKFDFDLAQQKLRECDDVLVSDFYLVATRDDFTENARLSVFETYCRIHRTIDIGMLAGKLNMEPVAAEKWIVNLIRNARLDAKIDSKANHVIMGSSFPTIQQQVIEKTKGLLFRSYVLANRIQQQPSFRQYGDEGIQAQ